MNCQFSLICLQETWLNDDSDLSLYQLNNYKCISQGKYCSQHGGLIMYLHDTLSYEPYDPDFKSDIWDGQFINVNIGNCNKYIYVANIDRPPMFNDTYEILERFNDEINAIITNLNNGRSNILLLGDFNINLLKINEKRRSVNNYLDSMLANNLLPVITFPTRFTDYSCSLIDNMFTNISTDYLSSRILLSDISDHPPYLMLFKIDPKHSRHPKYIFSHKNDKKSLDSLYALLESKQIFEQLNTDKTANPNYNYHILETVLVNSINKIMPLRKFKFHKHKHKGSNWITNGIIHSIKYRDKLYRTLKQTPSNADNYLTLRQNLKLYNNILRKIIREAKRLLSQTI